MKKVENEVETKKLIMLGRFVDFLKRLSENPNQYREMIINSNAVNIRTGATKRNETRVVLNSNDIKDDCYDIMDYIVFFIVKYDIVFSYECDSVASFCFEDKSIIRIKRNSRRFVYITCFKKEDENI